jgi:hypothetical protein
MSKLYVSGIKSFHRYPGIKAALSPLLGEMFKSSILLHYAVFEESNTYPSYVKQNYGYLVYYIPDKLAHYMYVCFSFWNCQQLLYISVMRPALIMHLCHRNFTWRITLSVLNTCFDHIL